MFKLSLKKSLFILTQIEVFKQMNKHEMVENYNFLLGFLLKISESFGFKFAKNVEL